jgi:hypothetical protein
LYSTQFQFPEDNMLSSWTWSLALVVLTTAMHSFGIVLLSLTGVRVHAYLRGQTLHLWQAVIILTILIAAIGLSLIVLHGLEAALWAVVYLWLGALDTFGQALLFSVDSMATRGASGIVLHQHWEFMGALEAFAGMLMFGISTAYVFQVLLLYWPDLQAVWERDRDGAEN